MSANLRAEDQTEFFDTVRVEIENKILVEIMCNNPNELLGNAIFSDVFSNLTAHLSIVADSIPSKGNYIVHYYPNKSFKIEQVSLSNEFIIVDGKIEQNFGANRCVIEEKDFSINIKFNNLIDLLTIDLQKKISESIANIEPDTKNTKTFTFKFDSTNKVDYKVSSNTTNSFTPVILGLSVGVNAFKNSVIPDLSGEIGIGIYKKGIVKRNFYTSVNIINNYENKEFEQYNFVNLGYRYNLSLSANKDNWIGIEVGYLVTRESDFFDKNTFKIGANWNLSGKISVLPTLYISDNVYPSLRVGFSF
jgi:hypothetical protein